MTVSQRAQYQDPETETAKCNSAILILLFTIFSAVICQNVLFVIAKFGVHLRSLLRQMVRSTVEARDFGLLPQSSKTFCEA